MNELQEYLYPLACYLVPAGKVRNWEVVRQETLKGLAKRVFDDVDQNNDGKLSPKEFGKWAQANNVVEVMMNVCREG